MKVSAGTSGVFNRAVITKLAESLYKKTHFSRKECESLLGIYKDVSDQRMDRQRFRDLLHNTFNMTEDVILDQVFRAFDQDADGIISPEEWIVSMSVFLRGTLDERIAFAFKVYDLNGDAMISREEMFTLLKKCLFKQPTEEDPDEGIKELVDILMKKMDFDRDNRVSLSDFSKTVKQESLLLEAFGPCLPDNETRKNFLRNFSEEEQ